MPRQDTPWTANARPSRRDNAEATRLLTEYRTDCELFENQMLRLNRAGARVICVRGGVLITAYNEPDDITLSAGDVFIVPNGGLVLIEGLCRSRVQIELRRAGSYSLPEGIRRILTGLRVLASVARG